MTTFFSSDHHFGHKNVVTYSDRPFLDANGQPDLQAMHRTLIQNWNDRVGPRDLVYHLGDFAFGSQSFVAEMRKKLNGKIILIRGNHDRSAAQMLAAGFEEVHNNLLIEINGRKLYLAHIPPSSIDNTPNGRKYKPEFTPKPPPFYHLWLCGHVHSEWLRKGKVINVGVDQWQMKPVTLEELDTAV